VFAVVVDGIALAQLARPGVCPGFPGAHGHVTASFTTAPVTRPYEVGIRITRPYVSATLITQYVDNAVLSAPSPGLAMTNLRRQLRPRRS